MALAAIFPKARLPSHHGNEASFWLNEDILPLPPHRRLWTTGTFFLFWLTNQVAISNFQIGSSLVSAGLSVWQAIIAIIVGKIIISLVAIANGFVGAEWHIGFPVVSRYVWGVYGSYVAIVQRIVLSLVWFAVQSWTGGLCIINILSAIFPSFEHMENHFPASANMTTRQFVGWVLFNISMIPIIYIKPEHFRKALIYFNAISAATLISMVIWALAMARGAGPLLVQGSQPMDSDELGWAIAKGVTTVIGGIAVGLTNQPDYSRFARRPGDQIFGQWFSIIIFGAFFPLLGCLMASATQELYGEAVWNPPDVVQKWLDTDYNAKSRAAAFFAGLGLVATQLSINAVDNAFSAGMDLAGLFSRYINIRRGAYIGLVLSIALCPWELLASASVFISVLSAYGTFLGPMIGIQVCDYFLIRRRRLKLSDLYHPRPDGIYYFCKGINPRAFIAWFCGFATQLPGFAASVTPDSVNVSSGWMKLYYLAFPVGFAMSFAMFFAINKIWPPEGLGKVDNEDHYGTFTNDEALRRGVMTVTYGVEGHTVTESNKLKV